MGEEFQEGDDTRGTFLLEDLLPEMSGVVVEKVFSPNLLMKTEEI